MSKAKRNSKQDAQEFVELFDTALSDLAAQAAKKLGEAEAERRRLLTPPDGEEGITITKEWLERYAEVHIDLGAASGVAHVVKALRELFGFDKKDGDEDAGHTEPTEE